MWIFSNWPSWSCFSPWGTLHILLTSSCATLVLQREMLLLDTIRREARRYVKSEAMFEEPNFLDLLMLNSAEVNLHDLEEEACEHLSSCFFVACALDAAEAAFLEDYLFLLHENQNFHTLRNGNTKKNMEEYFNARSVGMWRRIFEKNVEHGRE